MIGTNPLVLCPCSLWVDKKELFKGGAFKSSKGAPSEVPWHVFNPSEGSPWGTLYTKHSTWMYEIHCESMSTCQPAKESTRKAMILWRALGKSRAPPGLPAQHRAEGHDRAAAVGILRALPGQSREASEAAAWRPGAGASPPAQTGVTESPNWGGFISWAPSTKRCG